jgi:regulator of sirC expression with transglutaminase-like and TPR domain
MADRNSIVSSPTADRRRACKALLRRAGTTGEDPLPLAELALAFAALDRPELDLAPYERHLRELIRDTELAAGEVLSPEDCIAALNEVLLRRHGYHGDTETYDDLQNADLARVIDRRQGLPVALGILFLHAGRAQGWSMAGLAFPGHFLVRLEAGGRRAILDPFHGGRLLGAPELRDLLKAMSGNAAELGPAHYASVTDRDILLRLENNLKLRLIQLGEHRRALAVIESMLLFAPDRISLLRDLGMLNAHLGLVRPAVAALEAYLAHETNRNARRQAAGLLEELRHRLH